MLAPLQMLHKRQQLSQTFEPLNIIVNINFANKKCYISILAINILDYELLKVFFSVLRTLVRLFERNKELII